MPSGNLNLLERGVMYVKQLGTGQLDFCYLDEKNEKVRLKISVIMPF